MRAAVVYHKPYPENRGIAQLISLLRRLDVEVDVVALTTESHRIRTEDPGILYFPVLTNPTRFKADLFKPVPYFNLWKKHLLHTGRQRRWDCIFVRETLLADSSVSTAKQFSIPCFLDMRENRPDMLRSQFSNGLSKFGIQPYLWILKSYEKTFLKRFEHIFTVSEELKEWTNLNYAVPRQKISVLGNYPSMAMVQSAGAAVKPSGNGGPIKFVFAGSIDHTRGLQYILPALKTLAERKVDAALDIYGWGDYVLELKNLSRGLNLQGKVTFLPPVDPHKLLPVLSRYDVGLIPYIVNAHTNVTIPGKLFEYMAAGLPVVTSPRKPVVRIVKENRCGIVYDSFDMYEIAEKMMAFTDADLRKQMGRAGVNAIASKYNEDANRENLGKIFRIKVGLK